MAYIRDTSGKGPGWNRKPTKRGKRVKFVKKGPKGNLLKKVLKRVFNGKKGTNSPKTTSGNR